MQSTLTMLQRMLSPIHQEKFFLKNWGFEYWFENNEKYCGKIIQVRENKWSSFGAFHYHKEKDETFLVLSGVLLLDIVPAYYLDTNLIEENTLEFVTHLFHNRFVFRFHLKPYHYMRLVPGVLHRFTAAENETIFTETSTFHKESDSYRITTPSASEQLNINVVDVTSEGKILTDTSRFSYLNKE